MADAKAELNALVVGFLTSSLKENPSGFELRQFERLFPERTEEPDDWYRRYGKATPLDALKSLGDSVRVSEQRSGVVFVSLNTRSDKVDRHLVDLVQNQKASGKRKRLPARSQTQRVLDSFAINRRSSAYNISSSENRFKSRLNHDNSYRRSQNHFVERSVGPLNPPRATIYRDQVRAAPGDPRARQASSQMRPMPPSSASSVPPPTKQSAFGIAVSSSAQHQKRQTTSQSSSTRPVRPPSPLSHPIYSATFQAREARTQPQLAPAVDPAVESKRLKVKQRLLYLLNHKLPEIKVLYLPLLYEKEYEEPLDPVLLGFKSLTQMYSSFSDSIKISFKTSSPTLSAIIGESKGKENIASKDSNQGSSKNNIFHSGSATSAQNTSITSCDRADNKENSLPITKARYNAIDPFNVSTMLQSLEPLRKLPDPPLGTNKLEDIVRYRTMRIIFKNPQMTLKLDDWERKYQQEWNCLNRLQIRDYGYKTLLEFFKSLAVELPIKIRLRDDDWIAVSDADSLSAWLRERIATGQYRAVTAIDAKYEHIAFPGDKYSYLDFEGLQQQSYYPAIKMAVKSAYRMCLQMGDQERVDDSITFETSSSCYNDYKRKDFFAIPDGFFKKGFPCAAFDGLEQRWCRAILVDSLNNVTKITKITAFLVDYAITKDFTRENLLCILKNHLKPPVSQLMPILN